MIIDQIYQTAKHSVKNMFWFKRGYYDI